MSPGGMLGSQSDFIMYKMQLYNCNCVTFIHLELDSDSVICYVSCYFDQRMREKVCIKREPSQEAV